MNNRPLRFLLLGWMLILIAACGPTAATPTPQTAPTPTLPRLIMQPTARPVAPAPTIVAPETTLPGRLLFVKDGDIWQWQATAGTQLTHQGNLFQPAWSPNGQWIACVKREESFSNIVVMTASGGDQIMITDTSTDKPSQSLERIYDTTWSFYPAFAPDSRSLIFSAQAAPPYGSGPAVEYNLSLYSAPITAGARKQQLYASNEGNVGRALYAPDKSIAFDFSPRMLNKAAQIRRFDPDTEADTALPGVPEQSYDPAYSADGRWLAFASRDSSGTDLFAIATSGGTPARLTNIGTARAPVFSPDGKMLAFLAVAPGGQHFDLWVANVNAEADGLSISAPQQLTHDVGIDADSGLSWGK